MSDGSCEVPTASLFHLLDLNVPSGRRSIYSVLWIYIRCCVWPLAERWVTLTCTVYCEGPTDSSTRITSSISLWVSILYLNAVHMVRQSTPELGASHLLGNIKRKWWRLFKLAYNPLHSQWPLSHRFLAALQLSSRVEGSPLIPL